MSRRDWAKFENLYEQNYQDLAEARDALQSLLERTLKPLLEQKFFRVRLLEARVKDRVSLFHKVRDDGVPIAGNIFEKPGLVRDLIGARITCHNLGDIENIISCIEDSDTGLRLIRPRGGQEKRWIEDGQPEFGYRGHHVDVQFAHAGAEFQAELQVRTILQDAWATLMHEDVYKGPIKKVMSSHLHGLSHSVSDQLYALDCMGQTLRSYVANNPVSQNVRVTTLEALQNDMHAFLTFFEREREVENRNYERVSRTDRYDIYRGGAKYDHVISAFSSSRVPFKFLIGGDSGVGLEGSTRVYRLTQDGGKQNRHNVEVVPEQIGPNMLNLRERKGIKRKYHDFRVVCEWDGIFENEIEYLFAPWYIYYGNINVDYNLEIRSDNLLQRPPRVYLIDFGKEISMSSIFDDFVSRGDGGIDMQFDVSRNLFFFSEPKLDKLLLCLLHFSQP